MLGSIKPTLRNSKRSDPSRAGKTINVTIDVCPACSVEMDTNDKRFPFCVPCNRYFAIADRKQAQQGKKRYHRN